MYQRDTWVIFDQTQTGSCYQHAPVTRHVFVCGGFKHLSSVLRVKMLNFPRDLTKEMSAGYDPKEVEANWSGWWEAKAFFTPNCSEEEPKKEKFVMVIPPPNVTGALHLGHTLTNAIEDCLCRWHRMQGHKTLWVPGVDHAGIATQVVAERHLFAKTGLTRHDIGREEFLKHVWEWKNTYGNKICSQLRRLGVSVDWTREAFTMNPMFSNAVTEAFIQLFEAKLIYRATRMVSWCCHLRTALSDIEVETKEITKPEFLRIPGYSKTVEVGVLWYFKYELKSDPKQFIPVATTRIETMLGDVAVAVNDKDPRYSKFVGKELRHPFFPDRHIIVIQDSYVECDFGTGAVKITPSHDKNDYDIALRHNLPCISIFTEDGHINGNGGEFAGLHRFDCRKQIEKRLEELQLFIEKKPITTPMHIPFCSRSNDIVEYLLVPQWWLNCQQAAAEASQAVKNGSLKLYPEYHKPTWFHWLDNVKDWCISRQLWWGHRIPAYKVIDLKKRTDTEVWVVGRNEAEATANAFKQLNHSEFILEQDEDVLDTWFSSGLFPFAVFGWPEKTSDLKQFFPTTLLETGHDILFFWVARMTMLSLLLLKTLPFKTVVLHAMVRDSHGKKMSKSLGNVIDPIDVIHGMTLDELLASLKSQTLSEKEVVRAQQAQKQNFPKGIPECGADALRYGLLAYTHQGRSINLDVNRIVGYRYFCNKLWNATKLYLKWYNLYGINFQYVDFNKSFHTLRWHEQWILHRLSVCIQKTNTALSLFNFSEAVTATYSFWLHDLCDIYLEMMKDYWVNDKTMDSTLMNQIFSVFLTCFDQGLRLLHPMMPFVTEELYQRLPFPKNSSLKFESICIATYPTNANAWNQPTLDAQMDTLFLIIKQIRSLVVELNLIGKNKCVTGFVRVLFNNDTMTHSFHYDLTTFLNENRRTIQSLSKLSHMYIVDATISCTDLLKNIPNEAIKTIILNKFEVAIDSVPPVDHDLVKASIMKKIVNTEKSLQGYINKLKAPNYSDKVPKSIQELNQEKIEQLQKELTNLQQIQQSL